MGKTVSIPFREDLYSDMEADNVWALKDLVKFPSLSGKTSIRTPQHPPSFWRPRRSVSIPFREDLYSDFAKLIARLAVKAEEFPSLSGKTSIRTNA